MVHVFPPALLIFFPFFFLFSFFFFSVFPDSSPKSRRSLFEWCKDNPKKAILFACLIVLGIVLIIFLGLLLALLPVLRTTVDPATLRVSLGSLCNPNSTYGVSLDVSNPASVSVEVTRRFTVSLLLEKDGPKIAEIDVAPFVVNSGRNAMQMTESWRIVNTSAAAALVNAVLSQSGDPLFVAVVMQLPVRVYGGISLTLPLSFQLDLSSTVTTNSSQPKTLNVTVVSVGANSSMTDFSVGALVRLNGLSFLEVSVPMVRLLATRRLQPLGNISVEPFELRPSQDSNMSGSFQSNLSNLAALQLAVRDAGSCARIQGAPALDGCMFSDLISKISFNLPGCNTTVARRAASLSSASFLPIRLESASVVVRDDIVRAALVSGIDIVGKIPVLSFSFAGLGRLDVNVSQGGRSFLVL